MRAYTSRKEWGEKVAISVANKKSRRVKLLMLLNYLNPTSHSLVINFMSFISTNPSLLTSHYLCISFTNIISFLYHQQLLTPLSYRSHSLSPIDIIGSPHALFLQFLNFNITPIDFLKVVLDILTNRVLPLHCDILISIIMSP